jgi:hypothetical protein
VAIRSVSVAVADHGEDDPVAGFEVADRCDHPHRTVDRHPVDRNDQVADQDAGLRGRRVGLHVADDRTLATVAAVVEADAEEPFESRLAAGLFAQAMRPRAAPRRPRSRSRRWTLPSSHHPWPRRC